MQYTPAEQPPPSPPSGGVASILTRRRRLVILGVILLAAFGYFGFTAFQSSISFYVTVDELVARDGLDGASVRVKGALVEGSFVRESTDNTIAEFALHENGARIAARYDGALPDLFFNPHSEIVLEGVYEPGDVFVADRYWVKCPSKYQSLDVDNPYEYENPYDSGAGV